MTPNTDHLNRCIQTLESSLALYRQARPDTIDQEVVRNAVVKGYELTQETAFKLFKRVLKDFGYGARGLDAMAVNDLLRRATAHGLMQVSEVDRWLVYRDNRSNAAHDDSDGFAKETLALLPDFIANAKRLESALRDRFSGGNPTEMATVETSGLHLPHRYLEMVQRILVEHVPMAEVWAYGSRVTGTGHEASDLDLVVRDPADLARETAGLARLKGAFIESDLPIRVDVLDWARIPPTFRNEIDRAHVLIAAGRGGG